MIDIDSMMQPGAIVPVNIETTAALVQEIVKLRALRERLSMEARMHSMEARTANATIAQIYQIVSGAKGEPGNWNGAEPVKVRIERLLAELKRSTDSLANLIAELSDPGTEALAALHTGRAELSRNQ